MHRRLSALKYGHFCSVAGHLSQREYSHNIASTSTLSRSEYQALIVENIYSRISLSYISDCFSFFVVNCRHFYPYLEDIHWKETIHPIMESFVFYLHATTYSGSWFFRHIGKLIRQDTFSASTQSSLFFDLAKQSKFKLTHQMKFQWATMLIEGLVIHKECWGYFC